MRLSSATTGHPQTDSNWLRLGKTYSVLGILASAERGVLLQLFSDADQLPAFFTSQDFETVEGAVPGGWICRVHNGVMEIGFPSLLRDGFWEEFFNGSDEARVELERVRAEFFSVNKPN